MIIISHRINTSHQLIRVPIQFGVEIDIRNFQDQLVLHHEPFLEGELFEEWIKNFNHRMLVLNIKCEGIETEVLRVLAEHNPQVEYFLLDQSFPFLVRTANEGNPNSSIRASEYETVKYSKNLPVSWIWVDSHTGDWSFLEEVLAEAKSSGKKVCIASPELHSRPGFMDEISEIRNISNSIGIEIQAVCTKHPEKWI